VRKCKKCKIEKEEDFFYKKEINRLDSICKICRLQNKKTHYFNNKETILLSQKEYYNQNRNQILLYNKEYYQNNKEQLLLVSKKYYENNKEIIIQRNKNYVMNNKHLINQRNKYKRKNNPIFRLRDVIRSTIRQAIKHNLNRKEGYIDKFLPNSIIEIYQHLEKLFSYSDNLTSDGQVWMSWKNHGKYDKNSWKDDDSSTWTWQIDHIIPQSDLPYLSMKEDNFKKCWSLENLRPYSAKQNILDGASRIRHKHDN